MVYTCILLKIQKMSDTCTELVHEYGDAKEIANMLNAKYKAGWKLDRIINNLRPLGIYEKRDMERLLIYVFVPTK